MASRLYLCKKGEFEKIMDVTSLNQQIFRASDIRGLVEKDLTIGTSRLIGSAYGTYLQNAYKVNRAIIARDNRPSSKPLCEALMQGMCDTGVSLIDIGLAPSPLLYFAAALWEIDGGAVVTASHLPAEFNGYKLLGPGGLALEPQEIQEVFHLADRRKFIYGKGTIQVNDILSQYLETLAIRFSLPRKIRIIADPGNGVASLTGPQALRKIGAEVITINGELDGTFPVHIPNPQIPETMKALADMVLQHNADLGIAWDADGDRLGIIDERGIRHESDEILTLFAEDLLTRHPGAGIYVDVKISKSTTEMIQKYGGKPIMGPSGHSLVKRRMENDGLLLGGEGSGHIFFAEDYYGFDDAVFGACALAHIVARDDRPLSQYFAKYPCYVTSPEYRLPCSDTEKFAISDAIREHFHTI